MTPVAGIGLAASGGNGFSLAGAGNSGTMSYEKRDEPIDAYFAALDEDAVEELTPHLASDVTYVHPETTASGVAELQTFFDNRLPQDTTHDEHRRIHTTDVSDVQGRLKGEMADGTPREGDFCDVFEFDADGRLERIDVYVRL